MKPELQRNETKATKFQFDRSVIRHVTNEERADELNILNGIDVFDQHDFEQGVLQQANDAFKQNCERQRSSLQREIIKIDEDVRGCENELASIGELLETFGCTDVSSSELRRKIMAVKSQEKNKTNKLTTLHNRKYSIEQKLKKLAERLDNNNGQTSDMFGFNTTESDEARRIRLGEMTPFEARNHREEPSSSTIRSTTRQNVVPKLPNRGRVKTVKRSNVEEEDFQLEDGDETDEDYEDAGSDVSFETDEELGEPKKSKKGKKLKRKRTKLGHRHASMEDDWCDGVYQERIRSLQASEAAKNDEEKDEAFDGGFKVPGKIWNKLFPYQKTGVRWLVELHTQDVGGILGDEMGLGKTVQVIGLLAALRYSRREDRSMLPKYHGLGPVLIMCPATVMHQWLREFRSWWPEFKVVIVHSNSGASSLKTKHLLASIFTTNRSRLGHHESHPIVISSYNTVHRYSNDFLSYAWHYLILDEGHKIRNPDAQITLICKQFRTCHRIIMSGSPVQNNLKELWSLFDFIFPGKLGTLPDFMTHFNVPIAQGQYATSTDVQVQTAYRCAETLRDIIVPYLLRRMKSDVQSSVSLPNKNEQVLFCRLTDYQRKVYKEFLDSKEYKSIMEGRITAFSGLITIRKICNHPDICTGTPKDFWRDEVRGHHHHHQEESDGENYGYWKRSGKMVVVDALLTMWHKQGHKVLLFTQSRQMLDVLELFVRSRRYQYFRMDGGTSVQTRHPLVTEFNKNPNIFLFLLTTRVGGLGINLTGASRVIIYDPDWNPSTDIQARERAWRIGQRSDVTIYRLLTTGTIEEKIYQRQIFKQFLTNRVLSDPRQRRFFDSSDLRELFTLGGDEGGTETSAIFAGTGSEVKMSSLKKKKKSKKNKRSRESDDEEEEGEYRQSKRFKCAEGGAKNRKFKSTANGGRVNRFDLLRENPLTNGKDDDDDNRVVVNSKKNLTVKINHRKLLRNYMNGESSSSSPHPLVTNDNGYSSNEMKSFNDVGGNNAVEVANHISDDSLSNEVINQSQECHVSIDQSQESIQTCDNMTDDLNFTSEVTKVSQIRNDDSRERMQEKFEESFSNGNSINNIHPANNIQPQTANERPDDCHDQPITSLASDEPIAEDSNDHPDIDCISNHGNVTQGGRGDDDGGGNDDDDDKVAKWRILAKSLSQKIGGMTFGKDLTSKSKDKDREKKKKRHKENDKEKKKTKNAELDGSEIDNLDRVGEFKAGGGDDDAEKKRSDDDDNYVLRKLFKKSGIHSAMHHDRIVSSSNPDYRLVEMEAERVARDAERALKASRERCRSGGVSGEPTWTGTNGSAGAPRFGPRKVVKPAVVEKKKEEVVGGGDLQESSSFSASIIPSTIPTPVRLKPKKIPASTATTENIKKSSKPPQCVFDGSALVPDATSEPDVKSFDQSEVIEIKHDEHNQSREKSMSSKDLLSLLRSKRPPTTSTTMESSSSPPPEVVNDDLELMEDIGAFVSIGGEHGPGIVTSEELVNRFKDRVSTERSAIFKEMTSRICTFHKNDDVGTFCLKPEYRRLDLVEH